MRTFKTHTCVFAIVNGIENQTRSSDINDGQFEVITQHWQTSSQKRDPNPI